jgi:hypothetical protein
VSISLACFMASQSDLLPIRMPTSGGVDMSAYFTTKNTKDTKVTE